MPKTTFHIFIDKIRYLFLEDDSETPLPLNVSMWIRLLILFVLAYLTACVLFSGIMDWNGEPYYQYKYNFSTKLPSIFAVIGFSTVYLVYLYLVFSILIFSCSPDRLRWQKTIIPCALVAAYSAEAYVGFAYHLNSYPSSYYIPWSWVPIAHQTNLWGLTILYSYWLGRDLFEHNKAIHRRKWEIKFWIIVEVLSLVVFLAKLYDPKTVGVIADIAKTPEKFVITLSLFMWLGLNIFARDWKRSAYKQIYVEYLQYNSVSTTPVPHSNIDWSRVHKIVDFGCGNGQRLKETLQLLGNNNLDGVFVFGYDTNTDWEFDFPETFGEDRSKFVTQRHELEFDNIDLLFLSHVLYDIKTTNEISKIIKQCKKDTYIIIRGASPKSFFPAVSTAYSLRVNDPPISHLWIDCHLKKIENESIARLNDMEHPQPDLTIRQDYILKKGSISSAKNLLEFLYKKEPAERTYAYLTTLFDMKIPYVCNDDVVYIYQVK